MYDSSSKKLSVGSSSLDALKASQSRRSIQGLPIIHPTRNWPRRSAELLDGGCLFWIIKGQICVRQPIADLIEVKRADGQPVCGIVLAPELILFGLVVFAFFKVGDIWKQKMHLMTCQSVMRKHQCRLSCYQNCVNSACFNA